MELRWRTNTMINYAEIKNFQSHKDTKVDFCNGVNVIVGKSDSGKTAVLRALRLVIENKPAGTAFINNESESCKVSISDDSNIVSREKGRKLENKYEINGEILKAFSQDVPAPVKNILNFHDVNTQWQMDPPFLVSMTQGECSKYLNEVMNLDLIDSAISKIQSETRSLSADMKASCSQKEQLQESLKKLSWVDSIDMYIEKLETREMALAKIESDICEIEEIVGAVEKFGSCKDLVDMTKEFNDIEKLFDGYSESCRKMESIESLICSAESSNEKLCKVDDDCKELSQELSEFKVCSMCGRVL